MGAGPASLLARAHRGDVSAAVLASMNASNGRGFRTATVALTAASIVAASLTVACIAYDSWRAARGGGVPSRKSRAFPGPVHAADVFPLALSVAAIAQGVIFVAVQAAALNSDAAPDCAKTSQIIWPSMWIVFSTGLVFALEAVVRHQRRPAFRPRGRWNTRICTAVVPATLFLAWAVSRNSTSSDRCVASLAWWAADFGVLGVIVLSGLLVLLPAVCVVVRLQPAQADKIEGDEHLAARRMACYLALLSAAACCLLPFFAKMAMHRPAPRAARLATVTLSATGLATTLLYLTMRLAPAAPACLCRRGRGGAPRSRKPLSFGVHITSPIGSPSGACPWSPVRSPLRARAADVEGAPPASPAVYSLFPAPPTPTPTTAPTSTTARPPMEELRPPMPTFLRGHQHNASDSTSATVQIGLRMSDTVHAFPPPPPPPPPPPRSHLHPLQTQHQGPPRPPRRQSQTRSLRASNPLGLNPTTGPPPPPPAMLSPDTADRNKSLPPQPRLSQPPRIVGRRPEGATATGAVLIAGSVGGSVGSSAWI
ncbi:MAG: hypothetical protein M1832_001619 [Thelocarpon impressellum]|nr:MAG: hypothetical protein M1832_001619 [Thelocarpon impressellum]